MARVPEGFLIHENLSDRVYKTVRELIVNQAFPPGSKIKIDQLCRDLGVSRTPITEALRRLETEGLLESVPRHGVFVLNYSVERIEHLFVVREVLEGAAARSAAEQVDSERVELLRGTVSRLAEAVSRMNVELYTRTTLEFHNNVVAAANNVILSRFLENVYSQILVLRLQRLHTLHDVPRLDLSLADHREIFEAVSRRDPDGAERAARKHARRLLEDLRSSGVGTAGVPQSRPM
jgi:DNA-binding GntR family transcriptional regulator